MHIYERCYECAKKKKNNMLLISNIYLDGTKKNLVFHIHLRK